MCSSDLEHRIAETLQRSLLPERLPEIDGVTMAARYLPAGRGAAIGGDWYDAVELKDGRVALVVGDVVGHGLRAAATMGQLRNACRAYALVEASPSEVVARLNRLVATSGEDAMATVLYLVLDRETGEVTPWGSLRAMDAISGAQRKCAVARMSSRWTAAGWCLPMRAKPRRSCPTSVRRRCRSWPARRCARTST